MKDQEKKLIENLFDRLNSIELNSSEKDESADILIKNLVTKQLSSSYYMIQTILIQETAIEKMNKTIEDLKKQVSQLESPESMKKPSFLSGFFTKKSSSIPSFSRNNIRNNDNFSPISQGTNTSIPSQSVPQPQSSSNNPSFLSNALQTATGVAGGMILGNVLMNVFKHTKSEEEIFHTSDHPSVDHHSDQNIHHNIDDSVTSNENNDHLIKNEEHHISSEQDDDYYQCNSENHTTYTNENEYVDNTDINDDNFI